MIDWLDEKVKASSSWSEDSERRVGVAATRADVSGLSLSRRDGLAKLKRAWAEATQTALAAAWLPPTSRAVRGKAGIQAALAPFHLQPLSSPLFHIINQSIAPTQSTMDGAHERTQPGYRGEFSRIQAAHHGMSSSGGASSSSGQI